MLESLFNKVAGLEDCCNTYLLHTLLRFYFSFHQLSIKLCSFYKVMLCSLTIFSKMLSHRCVTGPKYTSSLLDTPCKMVPLNSFILQYSGLDELRARWPELRARKSIKTHLISTWMLFKVTSCFCVWKPIIFGTTKSDIHSLFQLRSCC